MVSLAFLHSSLLFFTLPLLPFLYSTNHALILPLPETKVQTL